jgi:hypothetical protein
MRAQLRALDHPFDPAVRNEPHQRHQQKSLLWRGTDGSNPSPSSCSAGSCGRRVFPVLVDAFGVGATMTLIAAAGLVTLVVVLVFAPETAGRSLEELEGHGL